MSQVLALFKIYCALEKTEAKAPIVELDIPWASNKLILPAFSFPPKWKQHDNGTTCGLIVESVLSLRLLLRMISHLQSFFFFFLLATKLCSLATKTLCLVSQYLNIFSNQMEAIVFIILQKFFTTRIWGISPDIPGFSWGIFSHMMH